jgi:hypothetical protein
MSNYQPFNLRTRSKLLKASLIGEQPRSIAGGWIDTNPHLSSAHVALSVLNPDVVRMERVNTTLYTHSNMSNRVENASLSGLRVAAWKPLSTSDSTGGVVYWHPLYTGSGVLVHGAPSVPPTTVVLQNLFGNTNLQQGLARVGRAPTPEPQPSLRTHTFHESRIYTKNNNWPHVDAFTYQCLGPSMDNWLAGQAM